MMARLRAFVGWAVALLYRGYCRTWRVHMTIPGSAVSTPGEYVNAPEVLALCERDALVFGSTLPGRRLTVLVAHGRDGDWAAALLAGLGCRIVRGASQRGGSQALRDLVAALRESPAPLGLVVDGPLGPIGRAKPGAAFCAIESDRPLRALGAAARHALIFHGSWSGIYLPLPFTRVEIALEPVGDHPTNREVETLTDDLDRRLTRTRETAVRLASQARW
jgi:lysophospholipid acyltransferase (LPLAT)-like uncharacterized protein